MEIFLHGGLGDGFMQMFTESQHTNLQSFSDAYPDEKIICRVISNNQDLAELYKHNPLVDVIIKESETYYRINNKLIYIPNIEGEPQLPKFYLDEKETDIVDWIVDDKPFVFIHPYSSTSYKQIETLLNLRGLVDYIIDELDHNVVFFGKSHTFDEYSHSIGYQDTLEHLPYERKGLYNFSNVFIPYNNPRVGIKLLQNSDKAIVTESGCFQAATYIRKPSLILLGKGMRKKYLADIDNPYFKGFKFPWNGFIEASKFDYSLLKL